MKITRDPVTLQPAVEIGGNLVVLKKSVTLEDIQEKPLEEIQEATLTPADQGRVQGPEGTQRA